MKGLCTQDFPKIAGASSLKIELSILQLAEPRKEHLVIIEQLILLA